MDSFVAEPFSGKYLNSTDFFLNDFLSDRWVITAAHCCGSELKETAPGVVTPLDQVQMTFGEHTTYQGDSVPEGLKPDRFFMNQQNSGL